MINQRLAKQLLRSVAPESKPQNPVIYATVIDSTGGKGTVQFDGAPEGVVTPVMSSTKITAGDRVTVIVNGRQAVVTGNLTSPSVALDDVTVEVDNATNGLKEDVENLKVNVRIQNDGLYIGQSGANIEMKLDNDELTFQTPKSELVPNAISRGYISARGISFDRVETRSESVTGPIVSRVTPDNGVVISWEDV